MSKAIIVSLPCETADLIETTAKNAGFSAAVISGGNEMRRLIRSGCSIGLIVINTPLSDEFGHELAEDCISETSAPVILLCSGDIADELTDRLSGFGVTILTKPLSREILAEYINQDSEIKETKEVLSRIDDIRLINRAKAVLMKYLKFTEPQAHRYIEKQAMNNRCTRRQAAEKIINTYEK